MAAWRWLDNSVLHYFRALKMHSRLNDAYLNCNTCFVKKGMPRTIEIIILVLHLYALLEKWHHLQNFLMYWSSSFISNPQLQTTEPHFDVGFCHTTPLLFCAIRSCQMTSFLEAITVHSTSICVSVSRVLFSAYSARSIAYEVHFGKNYGKWETFCAAICHCIVLW